LITADITSEETQSKVTCFYCISEPSITKSGEIVYGFTPISGERRNGKQQMRPINHGRCSEVLTGQVQRISWAARYCGHMTAQVDF